jgi:hypothetical protein
MVYWLYGLLVVWFIGYMVYVVQWLCGLVLSGVRVVWFSGYVIYWLYGLLVIWFTGYMVY